MTQDDGIMLSSLRECFEGAIPAIIATASAAGIPNVTYLSRVRYVDEDHIALSNQFFSKTARNLAENPMASVVLVDPTSYDEYRLKVVFERTVRRGAIFDRLREDVDEAAAFHNMQGVFKLKAADVFRVIDVQLLNEPYGLHPQRGSQAKPEALGELVARLSRCPDLDTLVGATVDGLHDLLGYSYSLLLLLDESGERLFTIASHGYTAEGVGSEVRVGEGTIGMAAARAQPAMRVGNLRQMRKYSTSVRKSFAEEGIGPGREVPLPGLDGVESRLAVPAIALGELVGVLVVESDRAVAFNHDDESLLSVVASFLASAIEIDRARERESPEAAAVAAGAVAAHEGAATRVRYFAVDGSIFLDGDYLIRGVAGRILWSLLEQHLADGRIDFTNKEIRLDQRLELPGFRDNLDTRLILLKRRLDERGASIRLEKTGRGRFRLLVEGDVRLEQA